MSEFQNILFIDTAMDACCVGVRVRDRCFSESLEMARGQAEEVLPMVRRVMEQAGVSFEDLSSVVTSVGPGTFTGLRSGLSVAKSFGLALDVPVFGVTTLRSLALSVDADADDVVAVVESKREEFYVQGFGTCASEAGLMDAEALVGFLSGFEQPVVIGNGQERLRGEVDLSGADVREDVMFCDPEAVLAAFVRGDDGFSSDVSPVYLRDADVSFSKKKQRILSKT